MTARLPLPMPSASGEIGRVKLLLSAPALATWGPRIVAAVPAGDLAFVTAETALASEAACDVDIAFMTREVTGTSSKGGARPAPRDVPRAR
jgi:D-2-hydroxyacid dehydrogenase (NADP+)